MPCRKPQVEQAWWETFQFGSPEQRRLKHHIFLTGAQTLRKSAIVATCYISLVCCSIAMLALTTSSTNIIAVLTIVISNTIITINTITTVLTTYYFSFAFLMFSATWPLSLSFFLCFTNIATLTSFTIIPILPFVL